MRSKSKARSKKRPCQPKTAKRIFGGSGSQGPSGQAKERTRILPVRRGSFCPARRAVCPGWPLFRSLPLSGLLAFVLGVSAFFLSVFRCLVPGLWVVRRFLFGLRCLLAVWPSSALFPGLQAACRFCANFCAHCLVCPPCALCAHFRLVLAVCSPVLCCVRGFSLLSFAFFCLTSFSQTSFHLSLRPRRALPSLVPSRGFVPGLRVLLSAAFSRAFAPIACLPVLRCLCGFSLFCFFTFSCLTFSSQSSFPLSLRPRREFPCLSPPVALFPACGSCHLLLFRGLLRPLPVCLFCVVYAGFLSLVFLPFPA